MKKSNTSPPKETVTTPSSSPFRWSRKQLFPAASDKLYQQYVLNTDSAEAYERFRDKSYQESYRLKRRLAALAGVCMQCFGALLATFAIYELISFLLPKFAYAEWLAAVVALVLLVLLESGKRLLWSELFSEKFKRGAFPLATLLLSLLLFGISAGSSTVGCYRLTLAMMDSTASITQQSDQTLKQIEAGYTLQIQEYKQKMQQVETEVQQQIKAKRFLTTPPSEERKLQFYSSQIERLQQERDRKLDRLSDATLSQTGAVQQKAKQYAVAGFGVSALFELMALLCIAYLAYYDFRVYLESQTPPAGTDTGTQWQPTNAHNTPPVDLQAILQMLSRVVSPPEGLPHNPQVLPAALPGQSTLGYPKNEYAQPIGFQVKPEQQSFNNKGVSANTRSPHTDSATDADTRTYTIKCKHCGKKATKHSASARYCSDECKTAAARKRKQKAAAKR
ncbi:zinc finger MYND domain-containing protein [Eisenibacter elegans]|jgi:phage-related protein|uniref:zinc finger MYND domain-containing protein n=1 Tax=Eisenibacter elegans TaxID=997 RepID=UPI00047EE0E4|nr:zinc finger MYND domain-containing protein [Eisenibacter elegans]